ncbi:MAG: hypothetical protein ACRENL_01535 [Candidatus Dormibacteria bacterium]
MASVTDITAALGAVFDSAGLRYLPYLSDTFTPPIVLIAIETVDYNATFGAGAAWHTFNALAIFDRVNDRAAAVALEDYMSNTGPKSIRALLQADPTLGAAVSGCLVVKAGPPRGLLIGASGASYTSLPFEVRVYAN